METEIEYNSEDFEQFLEFWTGMEIESTRQIFFGNFYEYLNKVNSCPLDPSPKASETCLDLVKTIYYHRPYNVLCEYCFMKFTHYLKDRIANGNYHAMMDAFHVVFVGPDSKENPDENKRNKYINKFKYKIAKYIETKIKNKQV